MIEKAKAEEHPFEPTGVPIHLSLDLGGGAAAQAFVLAIGAISRVHGDGVLPVISVVGVGGVAQHGAYLHTSLTPDKITINSVAARPAFSLIHEIGHFLDHKGISPGGFASELWRYPGPIFELGKAIQKSEAYKTIKHLQTKDSALVTEPSGKRRKYPLPQNRLEYLARPQEAFARAYAQYIAIRSGEQVLLGGLDSGRAPPFAGVYIPEQWENLDFAPIAQKFDEMFVLLGWMKPRTSPSSP